MVAQSRMCKSLIYRLIAKWIGLIKFIVLLIVKFPFWRETCCIFLSLQNLHISMRSPLLALFVCHHFLFPPFPPQSPLSHLRLLWMNGVFTELRDNQSAVSCLQRLAVSVRQVRRGLRVARGSGGIGWGRYLTMHPSRTVGCQGTKVRLKVRLELLN